MLVSSRHPLLVVLFVAAFDELLALAGGVGDHQPAAVEHADELLQLLGADRLRRKVALEAFGDFVEARLAVEHLQDRVFFFLEAVVLQADGIFDDPVEPALVALLLALRSGRLRIGSFREELETRLSARVAMERGQGSEVRGQGRERQGDKESGRQGDSGSQISLSPCLPLSLS